MYSVTIFRTSAPLREVILSLAIILLPFAESLASSNVTISETTPLSFGTLYIPTSSTTISISETGTIGGTATMFKDTSSNGIYQINGNGSNQSITIDIQNISTGNPALTLGSFRGNYGGRTINSFPSNNLPFPANNGTTLDLGATLSFNQNVSEQTYAMTFNIVVTYN